MDRRGVLCLFFDLPSKTKEECREYAKFRKDLKRNGYIAVQESVYVRLFHNSSNINSEKNRLKLVVPKKGSVFILNLSLKNFKNLTAIVGKEFDFDFFAEDVIYV